MTCEAVVIRPGRPRGAAPPVSPHGYARNAPSVLTSIFEESVEILQLESEATSVTELRSGDRALPCPASHGLDGHPLAGYGLAQTRLQ
jgi:hypothetical protein